MISYCSIIRKDRKRHGLIKRRRERERERERERKLMKMLVLKK